MFGFVDSSVRDMHGHKMGTKRACSGGGIVTVGDLGFFLAVCVALTAFACR